MIQRRFNSAHVIAIIALVFAIGSGAYAAGVGRNSVGPKQIKEDAVKSSELADEAVGLENLDDSASTTLFSDDDEDSLTLGDELTIASVDVPRGSYLVLANVSATNTDEETDLQCTLDQEGTIVDSGRVSLQSSFVSAGSPPPLIRARMPMQGGITMDNSGTLDFNCTSTAGTNIDLDQIRLGAIRVDEHENQ